MATKTVITKLPAGEIVEIRKLADGTLEVVQKVVVIEDMIPSNAFILIEAENISMEDEFMQYEPRTNIERETKGLITEAIKKGVKNFYCSKCDPFITKIGKIQFGFGGIPAVGYSYNWWEKNAKEYHPKRKSRLGTRLEYGAFLGVLMKKLVEVGKTVEWVWNAVCNDSKELGHYWNSEDAKRNFEPTGSRCICGFYDLANTYKILAEDVEHGGLWLASGSCYGFSNCYPLAKLLRGNWRNDNFGKSVGWIVLS